MNQDEQKRRAAEAALSHIKPRLSGDSVIGIGTGSTANHFIDLLASARSAFDATVASSEASAQRLRSLGIPVLELTAAPQLVVYVDGADEVDPHGNMIKGGGGALTREKIVASASQAFVCIVDESKDVAVLGAYPLPIEVIPMARSLVARAVVSLGGIPELREGFTTDNGHLILDVHGLRIDQPLAFEEKLNNIPGVVCCGVFARQRADTVIIAQPDGTVRQR